MDRNRSKTGSAANLSSVALRKESVDRNSGLANILVVGAVALRKESVDRNPPAAQTPKNQWGVALRKESVDRNSYKGGQSKN